MNQFKRHIIFIVALLVSVISYGQSAKLDSLQQSVTDSLKWGEREAQLQNLKAKLSLDSLSIDSLTHGVQDSIAAKVRAASNKVNELTAIPEQKIAQVENKITSTIDSGIEKVEGTAVGDVTDKMGKVVDNPLGNPTDQLNIPELGVKDQLPELEGITTEIPQSELELSSLNEQLQLDGITEEVERIKNAPTEQLDKIKSTKELQEATKQLGQVKEAGGKAQQYQEDLNAAKEGDYSKIEQSVEEEAEKQIAKIDEIGELQKQSQKLEQLKQQQLEYQQQLEQYKEQKIVKDQLKQRAAERGAAFFAQYEDKLKAAQNGYGSYKKKFLRAKNEKWWHLKPNAMKEKPFRERLVIGGYTQVVRLQTSAIDLSPLVGYKLTGVFVAGISGTYRLDLGVNGYSPNFNKLIYGYRTYLDAKVYKGFYLHGEFEQMSIELPSITNVDITSRKWVPAVHLGIGKHYSIRKKIYGYIQGLYNPLFEYNHSPYANKFVMRIGIEGMLGKKEH